MIRPKCDCHGVEKYWHKDKSSKNGGNWKCIVKKRELNRRHNKTEKGRASNRRYRMSEKGRASQHRYKISEKGRAASRRANKTENSRNSKRKYDIRRGNDPEYRFKKSQRDTLRHAKNQITKNIEKAERLYG